jgi:hypothetical protein
MTPEKTCMSFGSSVMMNCGVNVSGSRRPMKAIGSRFERST